jgi:hypothetical protein
MTNKRPLLLEGCEQDSTSTARIPDRPSITMTDEQAVAVCFDKKRFARHVGISVRSLDRANAMGLLPQPDLVCGRSPRWSPDTVARWLRCKPRLPGRGKGVRHGK